MMPTRYTADVADGTITELKPFIMQLARGMGALVMMRDMPSNAPIPEEFEPSPYYIERLADLRAKYRRVLNMNEQQAELEVQKLTDEYYENEAKARERHEAQRGNYEAMLEKVKAWTGAPEGIKEFALSQLNESIRFDCEREFKYYGSLPDADPENWRQSKLEDLEAQIMRASENVEEEIIRVSGRNAWLKQLRESLND